MPFEKSDFGRPNSFGASGSSSGPSGVEGFPNVFEELWKALFSTPVHLDSALSRQSKQWKSILAQITPQILLRPVSLAEAAGVGMAPGEPWNLSGPALTHWRPARLVAERIREALPQGGIKVVPQESDFPPSFIKAWTESWGAGTAADLVASLGVEAPLSLRVYGKTNPDDVISRLRDEGALSVKASVSDLTPRGIRIAGYAPVLSTAAFDQGDFEIQDEGSQIMAYFSLWPELFAPLLAQRPGQLSIPAVPPSLPVDVPPWTVVDACAGAGGKTLALADALGGKGRVYAYDTSEKKLQALRRRAKRPGLNNIQAVALSEGEEEAVVSRFRRRADVVLVDSPCGGWGVLRRNPDTKWRQTPEALDRMPVIQGRLLRQYSELVAPGGRLVFGVCTFRQAETTEVVESFLNDSPKFEKAQGGYLGPGPTDGFFMQAFVRKKS